MEVSGQLHAPAALAPVPIVSHIRSGHYRKKIKNLLPQPGIEPYSSAIQLIF
jgi:hypothetical protein